MVAETPVTIHAERRERFEMAPEGVRELIRGDGCAGDRAIVMVEAVSLRELPPGRFGAEHPEAAPPPPEITALLRLVETEQAERARLLDRLAAEQQANSEMRRLFAQLLAAREREKDVWQVQLDEARAATARVTVERDEEIGKFQRLLTDLVALEERFKTHKAQWIVERRRLHGQLDAATRPRSGGWLSRLLRRR